LLAIFFYSVLLHVVFFRTNKTDLMKNRSFFITCKELKLEEEKEQATRKSMCEREEGSLS
jgi:hypothetical protein